MPLFSSSSIKEGGTHHNKLGKSQHARAASVVGRKGSIGGKNRVDEDASTRAVAGSQIRLQHDDSTGTTDYIKPMTPKSMRNQSMDQVDLQDVPPTPPPHDDAAGYKASNDGHHQHHADTGNDDSLHTTSTTTWRENPDVLAMRNRGEGNDPNTEVMAGSEAHVLSGNKAADLATARQKIQFAIEAELAADRALEVARKAVDEARKMVGALERQAHEE